MYQAAPPASIDPIISRLRPRTVAELLDQAFRLYRRHFLTFIAIIAVVHLPLQLGIQAVTALMIGSVNSLQNSLLYDDNSSFSSSNTNELFTYFGVLYAAIIGLGIVSGLLQSLSQGALTGAVANSHLDKPVSFRDAYRQMFSRIGPLLGSIFLQLGIWIAIFLPVILLLALSFGVGIGAANSSEGSGAFLGLFCFSCLLFIPALGLVAYVFVRLYLMTPIIMVEHLGPVQAMRRSWELVRNYWWRTFALFIVLAILGYVIQAGPSAVVQAIVAIFMPRDLVTQTVVSGLVTVFTTLVFIPIQLVAVTLYYFDLRVRKEGYDLETALTQRYAPAPSLYAPTAGWSGETYGQPTVPTNLPPPELGRDYSGYGYGYGYSRSEQQPANTEGVGPLEDAPEQ